MQRIERKSFIEPIRKDDLQASTLKQRFDPKFQELCNTVKNPLVGTTDQGEAKRSKTSETLTNSSKTWLRGYSTNLKRELQAATLV